MKLNTLKLLTFSAGLGSALREELDYGLNSFFSSILVSDFTSSLISGADSSFTRSLSGDNSVLF